MQTGGQWQMNQGRKLTVKNGLSPDDNVEGVWAGEQS